MSACSSPLSIVQSSCETPVTPSEEKFDSTCCCIAEDCFSQNRLTN